MNERANNNVSWFTRVSIIFATQPKVALVAVVDLYALIVAILLPWSTTGVLIFMWIWVFTLIPTLDMRAYLISLRRPICMAPIALYFLAVGGTLWSDAPWPMLLRAINPAAKLLVLPLLFYHFQRSTRGNWVFVAFLASSTLLMLASWIVAFEPTLTLKPYTEAGVVVKNHIDQSYTFALCAVTLAFPILTLFQAKRFLPAALLAAVAIGFIANMAFVNASRTALIAIPIMVAVFALLHLKWRGVIGALCAITVLATSSWLASPALKTRISSLFPPYRLYEPADKPTSIDIRYEFWRKSLGFIAEAPVVGHGTGSTAQLFERAAIGQLGAAAEVTGNPHNQTLAVAIQWGIIGVIALYAMWLVHLVLFRGGGFANWIGLLVVVQNIISSLFNSHIFDFEEGWIYVLGVGVAGGMALGARLERS